MAPAESAEQVIVRCPRGTSYSIADAPILWFWARVSDVTNEQEFVVARQALLERDVFRDKLTNTDTSENLARPS